MERNAKAALSPHEETVLQRLANSEHVLWPPVPDRHVLRLRQFELLQRRGEEMALTALGKARVEALFSRRISR